MKFPDISRWKEYAAPETVYSRKQMPLFPQEEMSAYPFKGVPDNPPPTTKTSIPQKPDPFERLLGKDSITPFPKLMNAAKQNIEFYKEKPSLIKKDADLSKMVGLVERQRQLPKKSLGQNLNEFTSGVTSFAETPYEISTFLNSTQLKKLEENETAEKELAALAAVKNPTFEQKRRLLTLQNTQQLKKPTGLIPSLLNLGRDTEKEKEKLKYNIASDKAISEGLKSEKAESQKNFLNNKSSLGKIAANTAWGGIDLLNNVSASSVTGVPLIAAIGARSGAEAGNEALDKGLNSDKAFATALGSAAISAGSESMGGVGGKVLSKGLGKLASTAIGRAALSKIPARVLDYVGKFAATGAGKFLSYGAAEGLEEITEGTAQNIFKNIMYDENTPLDIKQLLTEAGYAFLIGGAFGTGTKVLDSAISPKAPKLDNILFEDKNRSLQELPASGLQLSGVEAKADPIFNTIIPQENNSVNSYDMQGQAQKNAINDGGKVIANLSLFTPNDLSNFNTARKKVIDYAKNNFPKSVTNKETGMDIGISRDGMDKLLSGKILPEKYASAFHVPQLIENANWVSKAPYNKDKTGIYEYNYFDAPILIGKKDFTAHIRVRETDMGQKYYGHTLSGVIDEIKIEPSARDSTDKSALHPVNALGSTSNTIIPQENNSVNSYDMQESGGNASGALGGVRVGKATIIKSPYKGETPTQLKNISRTTPVVSSDSVKTASMQIEKAKATAAQSGKSLRNYLTDFYSGVFEKSGGARGIEINSAKIDGRNYIVTVNKNAVSKVIADNNLNAEKLAIFDVLDDVIENGEFVGSGNYIQHGNRDKKTIRFDYFETPVTINGKDYTATFDVEVFPGSNNYRTHKVIDNMDLVPISRADTVPLSAASEKTLSPSNNNIAQENSVVNSYDMQNGGNNSGAEVGLQSSAKTMREQPADISKIAEVLTKTPKSVIPTRQRMNDLADAFSRKFVDSGNTINRVAKIANDPELYYLYNNAKQARQTAESYLTEGQANIKGEIIGDSLTDIFEPIRKKGEDYYKSFSEFLFHTHNIDRMAQNKPVFGESETADISRQKATELLRNNAEFAELAQTIYDYNRNLMQYRVDSGLISKESADLMNEMYPHYVPTFRDVGGASGSQADRNSVKISSTVKSATGSNRNLLPLHESMARQTMQTVQAAKRNVLGLRLLGDAVQNRDSVGEYIKEINYHGNEFDIDTDLSTLPELRNSFTVYDRGTPAQMKINTGIYDGLQAISSTGRELTQIELMAKSGNNTFKKLVTGYNPMFVVKNFARDLQDAGLYTENLADFVKIYPTAAKDMLGNSPLWQQYKALGGFGSSVFDYEQGYDTKALYENKNILQKGVDKIEQLNYLVEQAPRFTEFKAQVKRGGNEYGNLMKAMYMAADVTVNFGRSGTWGKTLNSTFVPFFNPSVQGFDKMIRRFTQAKGAKEWTSLIIRTAAMGVLPSLINALIYDDDKEYEEISDRDKDTNYLFKIKDGLWVKIPKGRVVSLFGNAAQRGLRQFKGDENAWAGFIQTALDQTAPISPFTSNIAAPVIAMSTGKTWYGTDIEPQRLQSFRPGLRYDENTDAFSKWLGGVLDYSPKKINYLLDSYTGVIGDFVLPMTTPRAETNPFMKAFTIDPVMSNKLSSQFYDKLSELEYAKNDDKDSAKYALMHKYLNKQAGAVSDLNKEIRRIEASNISDNDKRIEVREIKATVNGIQRNALNGLKDYEKAVLITGDEEADYIRANRKAFGAEYALQVYNKDVYEKATKANVNYDAFMDAYFAQKDIDGTKGKKGKTVPLSASKNKKNAIDRATPGMMASDRKKLYKAFGVSDKVW